VLCAKPVVGDEPFAVILADDLVEDGNRGCTKQLVDLYNTEHVSIIAVEDVAHEDTDKYGIVEIEKQSDSVGKMISIVEKPKPENAPSDLAVIGRYVLTPKIFEHLTHLGKGAGGEIQLTDAIARLLADEQVLTYRFEGTRYDCGSKLGYLIANVEHGLLHEELRDDFQEYLKTLVGKF
jgi:UTP--glucose-1-phosphate uridylyltransferase